MTNGVFTAVKSIVVDGIPMFLVSDVRKLVDVTDLEVTPLVVVSGGTVKQFSMVSLISLAAAFFDKTIKALEEEEYLELILDLASTLKGGSHESDPD